MIRFPKTFVSHPLIEQIVRVLFTLTILYVLTILFLVIDTGTFPFRSLLTFWEIYFLIVGAVLIGAIAVVHATNSNVVIALYGVFAFAYVIVMSRIV
jgi:hypothetical protein